MSKPVVHGKVRITDNKERQKRLEHVLKLAHNSYVDIGITRPNEVYTDGESAGKVTVGQVAAWMEFGTYSDDGKPIVPPRSFLRTPVDRGQAAINKVRERQLDRIIQGEASIEDALAAIGAKIQEIMRAAIVRGISPRLSLRRIKEKRAQGYPDTPLIATRFLMDHISYAVRLNT